MCLFLAILMIATWPVVSVKPEHWHAQRCHLAPAVAPHHATSIVRAALTGTAPASLLVATRTDSPNVAALASVLSRAGADIVPLRI